MSSQKGNGSRSRPQKYQNRHAFKNNLHDTSHKTKFINKIQVANVCERCKQIIEWKIKYKKYKPLKVPAKCNKCEQKTVKHAYHTMCGPCARQREVCPKCGIKAEVVSAQPTLDEQIKLDTEMEAMLKALPERKRRTFIRFMNRKDKPKDADEGDSDSENDKEENPQKSDEKKEAEENKQVPKTREELLAKLNSLKVSESDEDDFSDFGSGSDDGDIDSDGC